MKKGFTLIELMVVISIIAVLSVVGITLLRGSLEKSRDTTRKDDLNRLSIALAIYFEKNGQYVGGSGNCASDTTPFYTAIASFMVGGRVPKDPNGTNYCYVSLKGASSYRLCARLTQTTDPDINNPSQCPGYNYGVGP